MRHDLIPGHKVAPSFCDAICRSYGVNVFNESLWRVVWCPDRVFLLGGYWESNGLFEYRRVRRYGEQQRWILERYVPARVFGDPRTWAGRTSNHEGYLNQGPFPQRGLYVCTDIFTESLTPTLVYRTIQSAALGDLLTQAQRLELKAQAEAEREQASDERIDGEWDTIDNPRRGTSFTGGRRLNQNDDLVLKKAGEIAAITGGKFRQATSGFNQVESLETLQ
jgi:hypothetical protein